MSRHSIILSGLAVMGFLALGAAPSRADADVDGTDHSKLNHGVLGKAPAGSPAAVQAASLDTDVTGTDHSKLNHGVMGVAHAAEAASSAAPTAWKTPSK
jgi:hypothetical protein